MSVLTIIYNSLFKYKSTSMTSMIFRGGAIALTIQVIGVGLNYGQQVILARWMGPTEFGSFVSVIAWSTFIATIIGVGIPTSILRFIPTYLALDDLPKLSGVLKKGKSTTVVLGLGFSILGTVFFTILSTVMHRKIDILFYCGIWLVPLISYLNLNIEISKAIHKLVLANSPSMIIQPVLLLCFSLVIKVLWGSLNSIQVSILSLLTYSIALIIQIIFLNHSFSALLHKVKPEYEIKKWISVTIPLALTSIFLILLNKSDILMLDLFSSSSNVGIYQASAKTANLVSFFLIAVNMATAPMIASLHSTGEKGRLQIVTTKSTTWIFWPSLITALILFIFGKQIIRVVFGSDFVQGQWVLIILAIGQLINSSVGPVGYLMNLTGFQNESAKVYGIGAIANVILDILLIPFWGIIGAAIATSVTMVLWNVWLCVLVKKYLDIDSSIFQIFQLKTSQIR